MAFSFEQRASDSPFIHSVAHMRFEQDGTPLCWADSRWELVVAKEPQGTRLALAGPMTRASTTLFQQDSEYVVIKLKLGAFVPLLPASALLDTQIHLPQAASHSFWLKGSAWQFPNYENVETFVNRLAREDLVCRDPLVDAALQEQPQPFSSRTVRRRFLQATGLTLKVIQQIERAQHAALLIEQGIPILEVAHAVGYADQPHLTRSLKRFVGETPAQLAPSA